MVAAFFVIIPFFVLQIKIKCFMKKIRLIFLIILLGITSKSFGQEDRESLQPRDKIIEAIGVTKGLIIGEIGAGKGYLTFHLANKVGFKGKVFANEINSADLEMVKSRINKDKVKNIETVLGTVHDPMFPESDLDMVVMLLVLHHLAEPDNFMANVRKYLKKDGKLVIIERNTDQDRTDHHSFMSQKQIFEVMDKTDFKLERTLTFLSKDTIYIFKVKE